MSGEVLGQIVPDLLKIGIIDEVPYRGGGVQRRFKLRIKMEVLQAASLEWAREKAPLWSFIALSQSEFDAIE